ncbi:MAG TPA: 4-(cytidine 5'-diphospho)-2-C-methyl-D-erythritol kinase [Dehalococcoidia bacterium]|nr:4-(cytidine 5'-diphospho)-2-C-methyl-D-erythritol kinase [Dehalococcoidia bacterium]
MLTALAPAKINLVLEVLGRRDDGYHEVRSLVQAVDLCDLLLFESAEGISLECSEVSLQSVDNLVIKAAELLKEASGCHKGVKVKLEKRIPWGVGLGGGSSDAATTLLVVNRLWELGLPTSDLAEFAARLGSDVPLFIYKGMALVEGRGEKVVPLDTLQRHYFVLLVPPFPREPGKTKRLYSLLSKRHFTEGQFVSRALKSWSQDRRIIPDILFNVFDEIALEAFPRLEVYWRLLEQAGATGIHLAGSGPALFAPAADEADANKICRRLHQQGLEAYSVSTLVPEVV